MSAGHLSRQIRLAYGESPYAYLMTRRIERATALLRGTDLSVTDICSALECSSLGTFSTRFTEFAGAVAGLLAYRDELHARREQRAAEAAQKLVADMAAHAPVSRTHRWRTS
ncbi:hypothetical protein CS0771_31520 [Catellatospora sp. IY07-71]|nr:hypothetical protein CS0771_31520 [Catellatospora sp. IY07-71]